MHFVKGTYPAKICLFKVNNRNTRKKSETCFKLTIKTEQHHWRRSGVFIVNFEHISHLFLLFLLLTLRKLMLAGMPLLRILDYKFSSEQYLGWYTSLLWFTDVESLIKFWHLKIWFFTVLLRLKGLKNIYLILYFCWKKDIAIVLIPLNLRICFWF